MLKFVIIRVMVVDWIGTILFCVDQMSEGNTIKRARGQKEGYKYVSHAPE